MISLIPGRRIFTTTSVPSCSLARCTWAIAAAANGSASKWANTISGSPPRSSSSWGRSVSSGTAGTWLCSFSNSAIHSGPNKSARPARICPSLTKVGPRSSIAGRTCTEGASRARSAAVSQRSTWPARSSAISQPKTAHRVAQAVANEHAQNGVESAHIAGGTQGFDQHARMMGAHWFRS
jgi:hypothetical protein